MSETLAAYWWIIIPAAMAILALVFSLEWRASKDKMTFPRNYVEGLRAIISGDEKDAIVKLKQAVAEDTDNIDAYLKLGDLFRMRGLRDKAIQIHRELLLRRNLDHNMASHVKKSLAEDYIQVKKYDSALELLESLVKDDSFKPWALEKLLEVYDKTEKWEDAFETRKTLGKLKGKADGLAAYRHLLGQEQFKAGEYHKARIAFKDALHYDEKFASAYIMIAESYLAESREEDAAEYFKKLVENVPCEAYRVIHRMEQTMFNLGRFSGIESIYREILAACPDDVDVLLALADIAEKRGDVRAAIDTLSPVLGYERRDVVAVAKLAELYLSNGQQNKAREVLSSVEKLWSTNKPQYVCSHCHAASASQEIVCPNCKRVGPYKRT